MIFDKDPFIISEIGINHNGNLNYAKKLIDELIKGGASAVKFQTYKTEKRVKVNSPIFNILKKCELSFEDFKIIKKYCDHKKIIFFSTPFDVESVIFLKKINVKLFKISSFDISNYELVDEVLKTRIPTIISTGMASMKEIDKIYNLFKKDKVKISLLHCISNYPNPETTSYLSCLESLKARFNCPIGLSDHSNDIKVALYAYILGAKIIEKHFTLDGNYKCIDKPVSINKKKMKQLNLEILHFKKIIGIPKFGIRKEEQNTKIFKRK